MALSERDRDAARKRAKRKVSRGVEIPPVEDWPRRRRAKRDIYFFLPTYFAAKFSDPFTADRRRMVDAILSAARSGSDQAIAAPRGEGKTTICECVITYCILYGMLRFPLIVSSTGADAERILGNIKHEFEMNDLLGRDFPEVCAPIRALEGAAQRSNMQIVDGKRTFIRWSGSYVVFPTVPKKYKSQCGGSVLMTKGLDGAIRGIRHNNLRPDLVMLDDPETRESANSDTQTRDREATIEQDIGGLGGAGKKIARVLLCTVMNRKCLAWKYTDPTQKPAWNGQRYRLLVHPPKRLDMWAEYGRLRQNGMTAGTDPEGKAANLYYLSHRLEMDAEAILGNPWRFVAGKEVSALQHYFNLVADRGSDNVATEYQNDPPEVDGPEVSGITYLLVQRRLNHLPQREVPDGTIALTAGIDLGKRALHWTVIAWQAGAAGAVIDYGVTEVWNPGESPQSTERALVNALMHWRDEAQAKPYTDEKGTVFPLSSVLIDSGNWDTAVFNFCRTVGGNPYRPSKGFGQGNRNSPFSQPQKSRDGKRVGEHWYCAWMAPERIWLFGIDVDHWKRWTHERFLTPPLTEDGRIRHGSLSLWGSDDRQHFSFAHHIAAEVEQEVFVEGKGLKRMWNVVNRNNHWLDSTTLACVGSNMVGVVLLGQATRPSRPAANEQSPQSRFGGFSRRGFGRRSFTGRR